MADKIIWEFSGDRISLDKNASHNFSNQEASYTFTLKRLKEPTTKREWLQIDCKYTDPLKPGAKAEKNGSIRTTLSSLGKDLRKFMDYGVAYSGIDYSGLEMKIRNTYMELKQEDIIDYKNEKGQLEILKIFQAVSSEFPSRKDYYDIPVEDFNALFEDGGLLENYNIVEIKKWLDAGEYIQHNYGRYTNLARIEKRPPIRTISIIVKKLNEGINQLEKRKKSDDKDDNTSNNISTGETNE